MRLPGWRIRMDDATVSRQTLKNSYCVLAQNNSLLIARQAGRALRTCILPLYRHRRWTPAPATDSLLWQRCRRRRFLCLRATVLSVCGSAYLPRARRMEMIITAGAERRRDV